MSSEADRVLQAVFKLHVRDIVYLGNASPALFADDTYCPHLTPHASRHTLLNTPQTLHGISLFDFILVRETPKSLLGLDIAGKIGMKTSMLCLRLC